jgi:hypothetical protein
VAEFLCLDPVVIDRAARFLTAIGHLIRSGDRLAMTELGYRSLAANHRYEISARDRRKLYFAGFSSAPLPRAYYDSSTVTLLDMAGREDLRRRRWSPTFRALPCYLFDTGAIGRLAADPNRDYFNLPAGVDQLNMIGEASIVWLPLHVVRAVDSGRRVRYLPYSQAGTTVNDELTPSILASPVPALFETEVEYGRTEKAESEVLVWPLKRGFTGVTPTRTEHGTWEVSLPASAFGSGKNQLPLSKLGSWEVLDGGLLRLWCLDEGARRRALVQRINDYLHYRADPRHRAGAGPRRPDRPPTRPRPDRSQRSPSNGYRRRSPDRRRPPRSARVASAERGDLWMVNVSSERTLVLLLVGLAGERSHWTEASACSSRSSAAGRLASLAQAVGSRALQRLVQREQTDRTAGELRPELLAPAQRTVPARISRIEYSGSPVGPGDHCRTSSALLQSKRHRRPLRRRLGLAAAVGRLRGVGVTPPQVTTVQGENSEVDPSAGAFGGPWTVAVATTT